MVSGIPLSQALEGYFITARARRLSRHTLAEYDYTFRAFESFLGDDRPLASITPADIRAFLNSRTGLSNKTLLNHHIGLSALWSWALNEGLVDRHVIREVAAPKAEQKAIVPYTQRDVKEMLQACERTRPYARPGQRTCDNSRPTALRDKAIILLLVDTGMRASELTGIRIYQADLANRRVTVEGKGNKERMIPISPRTAQALWRYLAERGEKRKAEALFLGKGGLPLSRYGLLRLLERMGERADVEGATVHRFRHTFAIAFLRNGGNAFALQRMLGHSTLEMVKRYLAIAEADVESAHVDASPVTRWAL